MKMNSTRDLTIFEEDLEVLPSQDDPLEEFGMSSVGPSQPVLTSSQFANEESSCNKDKFSSSQKDLEQREERYEEREKGISQEDLPLYSEQMDFSPPEILSEEIPEFEDFDIFFQELNEELQCPIHLGHLINPVVSKCGHSFCRDCIYKVLETKTQCPIDRNHITHDDLFPNLLAKNLIEELIVTCPYGMKKEKDQWKPFESGCKVTMKMKDQSLHIEKQCNYVPISCLYCKRYYLRKDISIHFGQCPYRPVPCIECHKNIPFCKMKEHLTNFCPKVIVECPSCHLSIERAFRGTHTDNECLESEINCDQMNEISREKCTIKVLRKNLSEHYRECPFVIVKCSYEGCAISVVRSGIDEHQSACEFGPFQCLNANCDFKGIRKEISVHQNECLYEIISCNFCIHGCDFRGTRMSFLEHQEKSQVKHLELVSVYYESKIKKLEMELQKQDELQLKNESKIRRLERVLSSFQEGPQRKKGRFARFEEFSGLRNSFLNYSGLCENDVEDLLNRSMVLLYDEVEEWENQFLQATVDNLF